MPKVIGDLTLYDLKELSEKLDMNIQSLRDYVKTGKIKATKFGTKYYVTEEALKEYFNRGLEDEE